MHWVSFCADSVCIFEKQLKQKIFNRKSIIVAQFFRIQLPHLIKIENVEDPTKRKKTLWFKALTLNANEKKECSEKYINHYFLDLNRKLTPNAISNFKSLQYVIYWMDYIDTLWLLMLTKAKAQNSFFIFIH